MAFVPPFNGKRSVASTKPHGQRPGSAEPPSTPNPEGVVQLLGGGCASGLWFFTFRDCVPVPSGRPQMSRFSCILFLGALGLFDSARPGIGSRARASRRCGLPTVRTGSPRGDRVTQLDILPTGTSAYDSPAASRRPAQGSKPGWSRCSFLVGLLHLLQYADLSRRSVTPFPPSFR
jgi:hypothetical protein